MTSIERDNADHEFMTNASVKDTLGSGSKDLGQNPFTQDPSVNFTQADGYALPHQYSQKSPMQCHMALEKILI